MKPSVSKKNYDFDHDPFSEHRASPCDQHHVFLIESYIYHDKHSGRLLKMLINFCFNDCQVKEYSIN
jgi:hypothetical protein